MPCRPRGACRKVKWSRRGLPTSSRRLKHQDIRWTLTNRSRRWRWRESCWWRSRYLVSPSAHGRQCCLQRQRTRDVATGKDKEIAADPNAEVMWYYCCCCKGHREGEGTASERRRTGNRSGSRCHLHPSDDASTNQHDCDGRLDSHGKTLTITRRR